MPKVLDDSGLTYYTEKLKAKVDKKVDKVAGKGLSTNDYTTEEKTKLGTVESNAQPNKIEIIKVNNAALPIVSKTLNIDLSEYALKSEVASVYRVKGSTTWAALIALATAEVGDVYNVSDKGGANYVCTTAKTAGASSWDKLSETIDLSVYYTKTETNNLLNTKANDADLAPVAKSGSYDDLTNKPTIPPAVTVDSALSSTSNNPVQNKVIFNALNDKMNSSDLVAITNAEIDSLFSA